jgi:hypothetical protein
VIERVGFGVMKRSLLPLLAWVAPLGATACDRSPEPASIGNNAEMMADALERRADNLEAMAEAAANDSASAILAGAETNFGDDADPVGNGATEATER